MEQNKLKIFIIGPAFPLRGGPARFNENLCEELQKAGHQAEIISYSLQYPNFLFPGTSQYEQTGNAPEGIRIHTLINTVNPLNWFRVANFIRRQKPDFILFRYWLPFFGPSLGTIARLVRSSTRVLALTDNVLPHEKRAGDKPFTRYFLKSCDGFIAMSKTVLNDISKFTANPNKAYSPHPMYEKYGAAVPMKEAREFLKLDQDDKIVLFFGLIRHYKGLDILLESFASVDIREQKIRLLVAGEFYEDEKPYLEIIRKHNLTDSVILHNRFIPDEQVRYYFCAADLVAQTYRNATNSGVTMIGYYYGKPMLVTNVGGLAEIVPDNKCGYVVEISVTEISRRIAEYFSSGKEKEFSANVLEERKKYEWPQFIKKLTDLFYGLK